MPKIICVGFGDLMKRSQDKITSNPAVSLKEIPQLPKDLQDRSLQDGDAFLIGPYAIDPVRQCQRGYQQDPLISIVILIFPEQYQKIKQQIQFAYNVGKNVTFLPFIVGKEITQVLDNAIARTAQRKSFARISEQQLYPELVYSAPRSEFHDLGVVLENAPIAALVIDDQTRIASSNYRAKQMFTMLQSQRSTLNLSDVFSDSGSAKELIRRLKQLKRLNEVIKMDDYYLEITVSNLKTKENKINFLLLINDVTDKIKIENQLRAKVEELQFLNQEMDQFVNVVSHDFKTPLTAISLLAELTLRQNPTEKILGFVQQIKLSSDKLKEQLKGLNLLVDTTKSRSDKLEYVMFQHSLDLTLVEYEDNLKEIDSAILIDFHSAPGLNYFRAHIDSLFSNMVTNAIKYRNLNQRLLVEVTSKKEKDYIVLSFKDNGIGIDLSKNMHKVFQPFKRLTDQGTGSGLGLSFVKRMIERDHGYIEIFSELGIGTEFKIYLKDQTAFRQKEHS